MTDRNVANPYRVGCKRWYIAEGFRAGKSAGDTYRDLKPRLGARPFVFEQNTGHGMRRPLPDWKQRRALWRTVVRTFEELNGGTLPPMPTPADTQPAVKLRGPEPIVPKPEPIVPKPKPEPAKADPRRTLLDWIRAARRFTEQRATNGQTLDQISIRPAKFGRQALDVGLPPEAMVKAMTLHWPEDVQAEFRRSAGVPDFNPLTYGKAEAGTHAALPYVLKLAEARIPICLIGPAGWGKSTLAEQLAERLGLPFADCSIQGGTTPSWLLGSWNIREFVDREFLRLYDRDGSGGVFTFEEMDAGDANMLLVVNKAIANAGFSNNVNGKRYEMHRDFVPVACMNTYGLGANREYTGRERLDFSTMDRWRMGRVFIPADESLEETLMFA